MEIFISKNILSTNEEYANAVREILKDKKILALNLLSSPGAGKTTLLEKTLEEIKNKLKCCVIEGDLSTSLDKERISKLGIDSYQINTVSGCHLNAKMIHEAIKKLKLDDLDILFIENVGNLVCPAAFDIGEDFKIVILSTPEGDEKPLKYPIIFRQASVLIVNKIDLLSHVPFDMNKLENNIGKINPDITSFYTSCLKTKGLDEWILWLKEKVRNKKNA